MKKANENVSHAKLFFQFLKVVFEFLNSWSSKEEETKVNHKEARTQKQLPHSLCLRPGSVGK